MGVSNDSSGTEILRGWGFKTKNPSGGGGGGYGYFLEPHIKLLCGETLTH